MLSRDELKAAFNNVDTDGNGTLEYGEIIKVLKNINVQTSEQELRGIFESIDTNKDNHISFEEFVAWYRVGRTTKISKLVKQQLKAQLGTEKFQNKLAKFPPINAQGEHRNDIQIMFRDEDFASKTQLRFQTGFGANQEFRDSVAGAIPDFSQDTWVAVRIRSTNAAALRQAFDEAIQAGLEMAQQIPEVEQMMAGVTPKTGVFNDYVVLAVNTADSPLAVGYNEMAQGIIEKFKPSGLIAQATFESKHSLTDVVNSDNVATMGLSGNSVTFQVTSNQDAKFMLRTMLLEALRGGRIIRKKHLIAQILILAFDSATFTFTAKGGDVMDAQAVLPQGNPAQEMIQMAGMQYQQVQGMMQEFPFVADLLDALESHACCDADVGVISSDFSAAGHFHTEGVLALFQKVKQG